MFAVRRIRLTSDVQHMSEQDLDLIFEITGWIGSAGILMAYALNSYQKIRSDSALFLILNLTGGLLLMAYTYYKDAFANTFLNLVWVIVAVLSLFKLRQNRAAKNSS